MTSLIPGRTYPSNEARHVWRWTGAAFAYWLVFMSVLEPGNLVGALGHGQRLNLIQEGARLIGAGVLGAALTPLLLILAHRFPVRGTRRLQNAAVQGLCSLCLAPGLVVLSCVLAAWLLLGQAWPSLDDIRDELLANTLLVVFCLAGFQAAIQLWRPAPVAVAPGSEQPWLDRITIKVRGRMEVVDMAQVDWIETQGNYQALHVGDQVHLIRKTSSELAAELDPARFVRVHRQTIVAADRVSGLEPLPNGDAIVRLTTGETLRLSRPHRKALIARL
jgi:hypothetical protein